MKLLERRIAELESRVPMKDDGQAAFAELLRWALAEELDALRNIIERHHNGQASPGDTDLLEDLAATWEARAADPAIEVNHVHDATRRWHRDPDRRVIGGRWIAWLAECDDRDEAGETTEDDWATWRRLMAGIERFIVKQSPLPDGVIWGPGEGMPASLLVDEADDAR